MPARRRGSSGPTRTDPGVRLRPADAVGDARDRRPTAAASARGCASEATCTPGSVPPSPHWGCGDGHPSEAAGCPAAHAADPRAPTARRCPGKPGLALLFGLAPGRACRVSPRCRSPGRGLVSVALVLASRRTGVTRYPAPWSPDVPHAPGCPVTRNRPVASLTAGFYPAGEPAPTRSRSTSAAIARPSVAWASASRCTPSAGSASTRVPASRKAAPDCAADSR